MRSVPALVISPNTVKNMMRWARRRVRIKKVVATKSPAVILPHDMILEILAKLPVKFLLRFRCVSKSWNFIVSDPHFLKLLRKSDNLSLLYYSKLEIGIVNSLRFNNEHSLFSENYSGSSGFMPVRPYIPWEERDVRYDGYEILGSCNGLICVGIELRKRRPRVRDFILWNPSTRQFKNLPKCPSSLREHRASYGFGHDGLTGDYKLVRAAQCFWDFSKTEIYVFSVKSNTWGRGRIQDTEMRMPANEKGILLDGFLHWLAARVLADCSVAVFDLGKEKIEKMRLPIYDLVCGGGIYLGTLSGWLCFWSYHKHSDLDGSLMNPYLRIDVWVMKEYGVMSSWTKLFVVTPEILHRCAPQYDGFVPFLFSKEDEHVGIINRDYCYRKVVAVKSNIRNITYEDVLRGTPLIGWPSYYSNMYRYFPYMESLVPIGKNSSSSMKARDFFAFWYHLYCPRGIVGC